MFLRYLSEYLNVFKQNNKHILRTNYVERFKRSIAFFTLWKLSLMTIRRVDCFINTEYDKTDTAGICYSLSETNYKIKIEVLTIESNAGDY